MIGSTVPWYFRFSWLIFILLRNAAVSESAAFQNDHELSIFDVGVVNDKFPPLARKGIPKSLTQKEFPLEHRKLIGNSILPRLVEHEQGGRGSARFSVEEPRLGARSSESTRRRLGRLGHIKATILTVVLFYLGHQWLHLSLDSDKPDLMKWLGLTAVLYLFEAWSSSTRRYLSNISTPAEIKMLVEQMRKSPPVVTWNVECYHHQSDESLYGYRRTRRSGGAGSRIVTHRASKQFSFPRWNDTTRRFILDDLLAYDPLKNSYVKITLSKDFVFADEESFRSYSEQESAFVSREGRRDIRFNQFSSLQVDGFRPKMLAVRTVIGDKGMIGNHFFWFFTLLGLTVPYRIWFSQHCDEVDFPITKVVTTR